MSIVSFASLYLKFLCLAIYSEVMPTTVEEVKLNVTDVTHLMLEEASRLCQTASICRANISEMDEERHLTSCCQDCSCDDSCELRGDCCFQTAAELYLENNRRKYQECIAPTTKKFPSTENYKHKFYYMTTTCPAGKHVPGTESREDCGNIRIAPWGSLYPIYSSSTGRIYKNRACADCHRVSDGILGTAYMDCSQTDPIYFKDIPVAEHFVWLERNSVSKYCQLRFKFEQMLETEICFLNVIDTCNSTDVVIPEWSKMTPEQVIEACHNGISAIFQDNLPYSNVFCYLCNGKTVGHCYGPGSDFYAPESYLTFLLNVDRFSATTQRKNSVEGRPPTACLEADMKHLEDVCVPTYCPTGQIYNKHFQCVQQAVTWSVPSYHVVLRLNLTSAKLNISTLTAIIQEGSTWLVSPWPKWWMVSEIYYETVGDVYSTYLMSLLVAIKSPPLFKHAETLRSIKKHVSKPWILNYKANSIVLSAGFLEYSIQAVNIANRVMYVPKWYAVGVQKQQASIPDRFMEHSIQAIIRKGYLTPSGRVTKTHFCRQISLGSFSSGYELYADDTLLYYDGKFYYDGEFDVVSTEDGEYKPRICLSESPFTEMHVQNFSFGLVPSLIVFCIPRALLALLF